MSRKSIFVIRDDWKRSLKASFPVAMGYFPAGMAFGVLASVENFPIWLTLLISIIAFSGAAQYAVIPLIANAVGILNIAVSTLVINLRHVFYGLPLLDSLPENRVKRWYCLFALTDECFSVMTSLPKHEQRELYPKIAFLVHFYWVFATLLGVLVGSELNDRIPNLDFALAALFVILWFEQVRLKRAVWPSLLAIISYIFSLLVLPEYALLLALVITVLTILCKSFFRRRVG